MIANSQNDFVGPHEIIANGKWDHALFTTYALSLTFFETHILKAGLIHNGCQHVWVVADVDGYQQTLAERQSARVGQEYHLIPVALPHGVFHPKCIYLSGPDGDLLLVGSGNLTFGGFGRNVEVLEVLRATDCPWVFHAFGRYLEALGSRTDFMNPDGRWIETFSELAFKAAKGVETAPVEGPHLVHCVDSSIAGQLEDHFISAGGASRLRFLSPFYDPNADAVRELARKASCQRVTIGLLPGRENESTFPFDADLGKGLKRDAAVLSVKKDGRSLHAKWLEADLKDGQQLILTGSVNVTHKSMCTADNVEVGLIRLQSSKTARYLQWEPTNLPTHFELRSFSKAGLGSRWVVHAQFTRETLLQGKLMGIGNPAGTWSGFLARADGERVEFVATVGQDGMFSAQVPHAEHYATATAVQITLRRDHSEAVGWLHMEGILSLPRLQRLGITSLVRLVRDEQSEEDDVALLEYLALSAQRHLLTFKLEVKPRAKPDSQAHEHNNTLHIELERLAPSTEDPATGDRYGDLPSSEQNLNEFFCRLRSRMLTSLSKEGSRGISGTTADEAGAEDEAEQKEHEAKATKTALGLERFEEKMTEMASINGPQNYLKAVFTMWLEVELWMRLERMKNFEAAEVACRKWIRNAVQRCHKESGVSTFDRNIFTITATLAANVIATGDETVTHLVQLHEDLERYCGGPVAKDFAAASLVNESGYIFGDRLRLRQDIGLPTENNERITTAVAAAALLQHLEPAREDRELITRLGQVKLTSAEAALGASVMQSKPVGEELRQSEWEIFLAIRDLPDDRRPAAERVWLDLAETIKSSEHAVALVPKLRELRKTAVSLLAWPVRPPKPEVGPGPGGGPKPPVPPANPPPKAASTSVWVGSDQAEVEAFYAGDREKIERNRQLVTALKSLYGRSQVEADDLPAWLGAEVAGSLLEVHHIKRLADCGPDQRSNMIVLTPSLHALVHLDPGVIIDLQRGTLELPKFGLRAKIQVKPNHNG